MMSTTGLDQKVDENGREYRQQDAWDYFEHCAGYEKMNLLPTTVPPLGRHYVVDEHCPIADFAAYLCNKRLAHYKEDIEEEGGGDSSSKYLRRRASCRWVGSDCAAYSVYLSM